MGKKIVININAVVNVCLLAIEKYLPKYKSGSEAVIVNISSVLGLIGFGALPVYVATKHAVIGLTRSFADSDHYERTKVRVLTICPGATNTPLITESSFRNLGEAYEKLLVRDIEVAPIQPPEAVAEGLMKTINEGETGSVWIIDDSIVTKVKLPNHLDLIQAATKSA